MHRSGLVLLVFGLASIALTAASADSRAAVKPRNFIQNATNVCQAATKAGSDIRYRPKTVQNDGATPAFVSCSFASQGDYTPDPGNPSYLYMYASSNDGAADSLSCTAVLGYATDGFEIPAVVKTVELPADGDFAELSWDASDFGVTEPTLPSGLVNVSCKLNPGVGLNDTYVYFQEDVAD